MAILETKTTGNFQIDELFENQGRGEYIYTDLDEKTVQGLHEVVGNIERSIIKGDRFRPYCPVVVKMNEVIVLKEETYKHPHAPFDPNAVCRVKYGIGFVSNTTPLHPHLTKIYLLDVESKAMTFESEGFHHNFYPQDYKNRIGNLDKLEENVLYVLRKKPLLFGVKDYETSFITTEDGKCILKI